jgi:CheY-like chemotaxis protein
MLEIAISNTDRLIRLINEILDIERMQSGRVSMQKTLTDAGELAAHAAELMRGMANRNGITIEVVATAVRLWADPDRILQVLTNLLSNAIKFSPSHGVVRLEVDAEERDVLVRVCDRGRGIPPDKLESVFERFQQVDASDSRQKGGTGLGLAISRTIVTQHSGQIWAESTLGEGTTMSVRLPRLTDAPVLPASSSLRGAATILVCDDDPSVLEVVGTMLQRRGYHVVLAGSGHEALNRARENKPTLIVLDLLMPGQHSMELIEAFKEEPVTAKVPIVIFSVLSPDEGDVDPRSIADWVCKSLDDEGALMRAIVRLVGQPTPALTGKPG